jgi:DnaD/phage-associated family protein
MIDANDAQLKVYLYLLRMFQAGLATSVSDIADKFNHTEKDVIRSLKYWEKKQLLTLEYDEDKTLVGIRLKDINDLQENDSDKPETLNAPMPQYTQTVNEMPLGSTSAMASVYSQLAQSGTAAPVNTQAPVRRMAMPEYDSAAESVNQFEKPIYTPEQLREFKNRENTAQLLFITESYIGKPLTPSEIKCILFFSDVLKFSDDLIDYLIQYCVDRGKKDFKYIEKVALSWAEQGIETPEQAAMSSGRYDKNVYTIMNGLGKSGSPTTKELEFINRWMKDYGFSTDIILEACDRTVLATDNHRFEYAESILSSWLREGVHYKADIRRIDDIYQQRKRSQVKSYSDNKFNRFAQNSYDFSILEKELLSN